jgi:hypothetical protein
VYSISLGDARHVCWPMRTGNLLPVRDLPLLTLSRNQQMQCGCAQTLRLSAIDDILKIIVAKGVRVG